MKNLELNISEMQDIYFALIRYANQEKVMETKYNEDHYTSERIEKLAKKIKEAETKIWGKF